MIKHTLLDGEFVIKHTLLDGEFVIKHTLLDGEFVIKHTLLDFKRLLNSSGDVAAASDDVWWRNSNQVASHFIGVCFHP